jgi:hypothetical protein
VRPVAEALRCTGYCADWTALPRGTTAAVSGGSLSCQLDQGGAVACDIGAPKDGDPALGHVAFPGSSRAIALAAYDIEGGPDLCATTRAGAVQCCNGAHACHDQQWRRLELPRRAVQLAAGMRFTCALVDDGSVHCWARRWPWGLGHFPVTAPDRSSRTYRIETLPERAVEIAARAWHACARPESGKVACFGDGYPERQVTILAP